MHPLKKSKEYGRDITLVSIPMDPPEKICGKYFQSKCENEKLKRFPEWDVARRTPEFELIKAQNDLHIANNRLHDKLEECKERRKVLDEQWVDLAEKERSLRKSFMSFNKFVRENQEKRERAERRYKDEQLIHAVKDTEIIELKAKIEKMTSVLASLQHYCGKFKFYEDYLSDVVEGSIEFKTINDVLNRYDTLTIARSSLIERQKADLESLEMERANMVHLLEEKSNVLMGLNNKLAMLQNRYEKAKSKSAYWDVIVNKVKSKTTRQILQIDMVEHACWSLYLQMCKRKEVEPELEKDNIEEQLLFIKQTLLEFKRIMKIAQKRINRDLSSVKTGSSVPSD